MQLNWKPSAIFYGWWIVIACCLISTYASGVIWLGFTAIFDPIVREFGWSYAHVSFAASMRGLESGLLSPVVGFLIDRLGARKLIFGGVIIVGLGLLLLSHINSLLTFYGAFVLIAIGISTTSGIVPIAVVGKWFRRKVSTATGIVVSGTALGGLIVPVLTRIIDIFEWRTAILIFGLGAWGILLPLSMIVRQKPEQYGYLPDGEVSTEPAPSESITLPQSAEIDIGVRQSLKSRAFWHITLGMAFNIFVVLTVITHIMPYLSTVDMARSTASLVAGAIPLISIFGRTSFGWFGDKYDKRRVATIGVAQISISMFILSYIDATDTWLLVPFIILFGIGWGGTIPMHAGLLQEYFGRASLGKILGLSYGITMLLSIAGPPLAGALFDSFGSYQYAWFTFLGVAIAGLVSFATTPSISSKSII